MLRCDHAPVCGYQLQVSIQLRSRARTASHSVQGSVPLVTVTVEARPVAVALSATVNAGQTVQVDLTAGARGGPFTDASVVSLTPAQSGHGSIVKTATGYRLDFASAAAFSGQAQLVYTIANAYATSQPATVTITVTNPATRSRSK